MSYKDQQLLEEAYKSMYIKESYLDKLKKLNPGWNPEKAKGDFADEYDPNDVGDIEDHVDYEENAAEWLDDISNFVPGVKVGDWVKVKVHGGGGVKSGWQLGKIEEETITHGHDYGHNGYKGPTKIPAWSIKVFVPVKEDGAENSSIIE